MKWNTSKNCTVKGKPNASWEGQFCVQRARLYVTGRGGAGEEFGSEFEGTARRRLVDRDEGDAWKEHQVTMSTPFLFFAVLCAVLCCSVMLCSALFCSIH